MRRHSLVMILILAIMPGTTLFAITHQENRAGSLLEGNLASISIGANFESGTRMLVDKSSGETALVRLTSYDGYIGWDLFDWLTIFGTLGVSSAEPDGSPVSGDARTKWSVGTSACIVHSDIDGPDPFNGRWSLDVTAEYAQYQTKFGRYISWTDIGLAMPVSYTLRGMRTWPFCDLVISGGPALSYIDGSGSFPGVRDFEQNQSVGAVGGLDVTLFDGIVSVGAHIQHFGNVEGGYSVRWNF